MDKPKKKKIKVNKRFYAIIFVCIFIYCAFAFVSQRAELARIEKERAQIEEKIRLSKIQFAELTYMLEYSKTSEYVQTIAREKLGLVTQSETRYLEE